MNTYTNKCKIFFKKRNSTIYLLKSQENKSYEQRLSLLCLKKDNDENILEIERFLSLRDRGKKIEHTVMEALQLDEAEVVETCPVCVKSDLNPCAWG